MKFEEYVPLAMRTSRGLNKRANLVNACLGLAGEYAEYETATDKNHKREEIGDIYWYVALLANNYDYTPTKVTEHKGSLLSIIGFICDSLKKAEFQGHDLSEDALDIAIAKLLSNLEEECKSLEVTPSEIMQGNVDKLRKRFPEGFEVERSVNRA